jgi:hypothetical protein
MQQRAANPLLAFVNWMGGWSRFIALVVVLLGLVGWYLWERGRDLPLPPQAQNVAESLGTDSRDTTFVFGGSAEELRAFYQQALPPRGWRYCGTRATAGCTNRIVLNDASDQQTDVYRRADDQDSSGPTIEIWWLRNASGELRVSISETRGPL